MLYFRPFTASRSGRPRGVAIPKRTAAALTIVLTLAAALLLTVVRMNAGDGSSGAGRDTAKQSPGLPSEPTQIIYDGNDARDFQTLGQLVATSAAVVKAEVVAVQPGNAIQLGDSSGRVIVPRLLVLDVDQVLYGRAAAKDLPDQIQVNDGYWEDGDGYAREGLEWAQPGITGYFFLTQDRGPNGELRPTFSLSDMAGRVLLEGNHAEHADDEVWGPDDALHTPKAVAAAVVDAIADVRAGVAKPVLIDVCRPSIPGDENSDPICTKE
jgi:hypothetical protein